MVDTNHMTAGPADWGNSRSHNGQQAVCSFSVAEGLDCLMCVNNLQIFSKVVAYRRCMFAVCVLLQEQDIFASTCWYTEEEKNAFSVNVLNKINVLKGFYCCQGARGLSASWGMGSQEPRAITQPAGQGHHQPRHSPTVPKRDEQSSTRHRGQVQSTASVLRGAGVDEAGPMSIHMSGSRSVESMARYGSGHGCTGNQQFYNISQARF